LEQLYPHVDQITKEKCVQSYLEWYHENLKQAGIL